ncbi:MAG: polysaccharide deacetylase family protein [bacterium]
MKKIANFRIVFFLIGILIFVAVFLCSNFSLAKTISTPSTKIKVESLDFCDNGLFKIRLPILMYHHIGSNPNPENTPAEGLYTPINIFENQLALIKEANINSITVREAGEIMLAKQDLSGKSIVLTFDDGYDDFYTNAYPLLKKYQLKGVLYVITDFVGQPGYITASQAKEMAESGVVEIASHTLNHPDMKQLNSKDALKQLVESKANLEKIIGQKVYDFAFPYGFFRHNELQLVRKAGYLTSASTLPGLLQYSNNRFYLFRERPGRREGQEFSHWLSVLEGEKATTTVKLK